ncbi:MAG: DUF3494 domain-containing protein [Acidobacteriota bacterium]
MTQDKLLLRKYFGWRAAGVIFLAIPLCCPFTGFAGVVTLGSAQNFAVLSGAGATVGGACCTVVSGSLGDYPLGLSSITGFPTPGSLVNGTFYASDQLSPIAEQARADENTAYNTLTALPSTANESGVILGTGGTVGTLLPGVYTFASSAQMEGTLTLDFNGQSNAMFVFQIATTLTTGSGAVIHVIGANPTNSIYWQVGSSATLGSNTIFAGNILASDSITLGPGAAIACGRAFAYTGSVTMADTNFISDNCSLYNTLTGYSSAGPTDFGSYGFSGNSQATPEPGTFLLLGIGFAGFAGKCSGRRRQVAS